ncbi:MAG TPA: hypothetical protein VF377_02215 [Acidimicrobiia bacterium]
MLNDYLKLAVQQAAKGEMLKGVLWLVGGAVVTGITYSAAEPGGTFFVFWGAMAYGAIRFLRGLYYANPKALLDKQQQQPR